MGKVSLGIYDKEAEYAKRLGRFIRRKCGEQMEVRIFTKIETLKKCLDSGGIGMALVSADAEELCLGYKDIHTIILSDEAVRKTRYCLDGAPADVLRETSNFEETKPVIKCPFIDKYQSAEGIWKSLLTLAGDYIYGKEDLRTGTLTFEMYAVVSPVHRTGKTILAFSLGKKLAERKEGRVLIISMDEFSCLTWAEDSGSPEGGDLTELFYYYSQGQLNSGRICAAVSHYGEADYLKPAKIPEDLYREGKPYPAAFFEQLAQQGGYQYLIIDIGNTLAFHGGILRLCSNLFIPEPELREDMARLAMFQEWLMRQEIEGKQIICQISGVQEFFDMEWKAAGFLKQRS